MQPVLADSPSDERVPESLRTIKEQHHVPVVASLERPLHGPDAGQFSEACLELGVTQKLTRAFRPQTNGKAERFIQSALRE